MTFSVVNQVSLRKLTLVLSMILGAGLSQAATPDISGPWEITKPAKALKTSDGKAPPLTAEGKKLYQQNQANLDSDPIKGCLPPGIPRALMQPGFPFSIVVGEALSGMMIQWNHLPRAIYMNKAHFENIGPQYLGQSVAHWEGDTLVIDTNGYNDKTWLDDSGLPHSEDLHTVERLRLKDANTLQNTITFEDKQVFSKSWQTLLTFTRKPGVIIQEDYCLGRLGLGVTVSR